MIALTFVLMVSGLKEAYEDIQRHKADKQANKTPVEVKKPYY